VRSHSHEKRLLPASRRASVRLSVCLQVSARAVDGFPLNFVLGTSMEICLENPYLVKIEQSIGKFTRIPKYVLLLPVA